MRPTPPDSTEAISLAPINVQLIYRDLLTRLDNSEATPTSAIDASYSKRATDRRHKSWSCRQLRRSDIEASAGGRSGTRSKSSRDWSVKTGTLQSAAQHHRSRQSFSAVVTPHSLPHWHSARFPLPRTTASTHTHAACYLRYQLLNLILECTSCQMSFQHHSLSRSGITSRLSLPLSFQQFSCFLLQFYLSTSYVTGSVTITT